MTNFLSQFLGTSDTISFIVSYVFAIIGLIISLNIGVKKRNKISVTTPYAFSWNFFFLDNLMRILFNLLVLFVSIRFYKEINGTDINPVYALGVGLAFDQLIALLKKVNLKARY